MQRRCEKCQRLGVVICDQPRVGFACGRCHKDHVRCSRVGRYHGPRREIVGLAQVSRYAIAPLSSGVYAGYHPETASWLARAAHDGLMAAQAARDEYRALLEVLGTRPGETKDEEERRVRAEFTERMERELLGDAEEEESEL